MTQATPQYKEFAPTTQTDFSSKLNDLNDSSLRNYFKMTGSPSTSLGDAAFDAMLLGKNKQFKQERAAAKQEADQFGQEAKQTIAQKNEDAKKAYTEAYGKGTQAIKDAATAELDPIRQRAEAQAAGAEAERARYAGMSAPELIKNTPGYQDWLRSVADQVGDSPEQRALLYQNIAQGFGQGQADTSDMGGFSLAGRVGVNPALNFVNVAQAPITANNYLTSDQAAELNRGRQLLGLGGPSYAASGGPASPYSFNAEAARAYLGNILGKNTTEQQAQAQKDTEFNAAVKDALLARQQTEEGERARERQRKRDNDARNAATAATGGASDTSREAMQKGQEAIDKGKKYLGL
jgi:hypothetical protein